MNLQEELTEIGDLLIEMAERHTIEADTEQRKGSFHPSSITNCPRYQMFEYLGAPSSPIPARRIEQGQQFDTLVAGWANQLSGIGYEVYTQQPLPLTGDYYGLAGHCDIYLPQLPSIIEVKHTNMAKMKTVREKGEVGERWYYQLQCYLWMAQCEVGLLFMEAVDYFGRVNYHHHLVWADQDAVNSIRNRLIILNQYLEKGELPPGDCSSPTDCPYFATCYGGKE